MQELVPAAVVHRIADFTGQRDMASLERTLLAAVNDLFSPEWSALYTPGEGDEYGAANGGSGDFAGADFSVALRDGETLLEPLAPTLEELARGLGVMVLPMAGRSRKLMGYLALKRSPALNAREQRVAADLFRIFDNTVGLLREAHFDRLTGLLNRHTFETQLDRVLEMARRTSRRHDDGTEKRMRFFLGELDIDHFKSVNDRYGHLYGDEVLLIVARMLKSNFRKSDLVFRFGGEEFVVIVVAETCAGAALSFERARKRIEDHVFPKIGQVTVSVGLTEIRESDAPVQILGQADQALFYAKNHGRNQVCFYETLLEGGLLDPFHATSDITIF